MRILLRLARATLCLPTGVRSGRRVAGPDEDPFTFVASALERALPARDRRAAPVHVAWLGEDCRELDWAVPVVLGASAEVVRDPRGPSGLREACERAQEDHDRISIVVGSEVLRRGSDGSRSASPEAGPDGGFALTFAPEGPLEVSEVLPSLAPVGSLLRSAFAFRRAWAARAPRSVWEGDWEEASRPSRELGPEPVARTDRLASVSEGAYVSRPRYLEQLPSRWRFVSERCGACGAYTFPVRGRCRACGRTQDLVAEELPRDGGLVVASTIIGPGGQPTEFDPVVETLGPYQVVLAELAPGARVPLQVTDAAPGAIRIGDRIDTRLRRLYAMEGEWRYGRKAVPTARPPPEPSPGPSYASSSFGGGAHFAPSQLSKT